MDPSGSTSSFVSQARHALEEGRLSDAGAAIDAMLHRDAGDATAWLFRGVLELQRSDPASAAAAFERAERLGADRRRSRLGAGMAALELGEAERAWTIFDAVAREHGDDAETMHWLLCAGTALGRWAELAERLEGFVTRHPDAHAIRFALGAVCLRLGDADRARRHHEVLRERCPGFDGLEDLGRALAG